MLLGVNYLSSLLKSLGVPLLKVNMFQESLVIQLCVRFVEKWAPKQIHLMQMGSEKLGTKTNGLQDKLVPGQISPRLIDSGQMCPLTIGPWINLP